MIRHIPRALGLSESEAGRFLDDVGLALGFNITTPKGLHGEQNPLQYRKHLGSDVLSPFSGRQKELSELRKWILGRHSVMITGLGGVGKTRLAQELLRSTLTEFAHGCEYLEISPGQSSLQVLKNVVYLLGMDLPPDAFSEANRELILEKNHLHIGGVSLIFLVDNVENAEQVRFLVRALPEITWVFTARRASLKSVGVFGLELEPPPTAEAIEIFRAFAHLPDSQRSDLEEIVDVLGRLPLALRLAASLLENGIVASPSALREWLAEKGLLSSRSLASNLRALFGHLLENVPADARFIFEICGAFSGRNIRMANVQNILKKLAVRPSPEAWSALGDFSLINFPDETNLELHPLVHEYAGLRLQSSHHYAAIWEQFKAAYLEMAESLATYTDESQRAYRLFVPEEANLLRVVEDFSRVSDWAGLRRMGPVLEGYFWQSSNYADYERVELMCLQGAQKNDDFLLQAQSYAELGFLKMVQENRGQAEDFMLRSQAIYDSLPDQRFGQARIRRYRSILAIGGGQFEQAVELHEDVEARLAQLTNPPEAQLDVAKFWLHTSRMEVFYRMGDLAQAKVQGSIAGQFYEKINQSGSYRARDFGVIYGDVLFGLGDLTEAIGTWNKMLFFGDGLPLQVEEADALSRLGFVNIQQEDIEQAKAQLEQAGRIYLKFGQAAKFRRVENLIERIETVQEVPGFRELFERW